MGAAIGGWGEFMHSFSSYASYGQRCQRIAAPIRMMRAHNGAMLLRARICTRFSNRPCWHEPARDGTARESLRVLAHQIAAVWRTSSLSGVSGKARKVFLFRRHRYIEK